MAKPLAVHIRLNGKLASAFRETKTLIHASSGVWPNDAQLARELLWGGLKRRETAYPGHAAKVDFCSND